MPPKKRQTKKSKNRKHIIRLIVQPILLASLALLLLSAVTLVARAFSTTTLAHKDGIPAHWQVSSADLPDTISIPVTYWDQISEPCSVKAEDRQFEFTRCNLSSSTVQTGIVKDTLGTDGLPVPTNTTTNKKFLNTSWGVTGHDPVLPTDNFYRWFHEVDGKSKLISDRTIEFKKIGDKLYQYGGSNVFPLDDIDFSDGDYSAGQNHNFHFTMHFSAPFYVTAGSDDYFQFEGDDDVWVFVNGKLVLDIGGLHSAITGHFKINSDATITATVNGKSQIIDAGLRDGMRTTIDLFYAERSTTAANCKITINNMLQPISTTPTISSKLTDDGLIEYVASIRNDDPTSPIQIDGFSSFLRDQDNDLGFLNLDHTNLSYSTSPDTTTEWSTLDINAPAAGNTGFTFADSITLSPHGQSGDTLYLHFYARPTDLDGQLDNITSFLVSRDKSSVTAIASTDSFIEYSIPTPPEGGNTDEDDDTPTVPSTPPSDLLGDDLDDDIDLHQAPLGEMLIVSGFTAPNTGLGNFADIILSQSYVLAVLGVFAVSFAIYWQVRNY